MPQSRRISFLLAAAGLCCSAPAQTCPLQPLQPNYQQATARWSALFDDLQTGRPRLYITGNLDRLGAVSGQTIARWDGQGWAPVPGAPAHLGAMTVHHDGAGEALIVATTDVSQFGEPHRLWRYDGAAWSELPALDIGPLDGTSTIASLASLDPDGPGPLPARLFASASVMDSIPHAVAYYARVAVLDGGAWTVVGAAPIGPLVVYDPDGAGPLPASLYAVGTFTSVEHGITDVAGYVYQLQGSTFFQIASLDYPSAAAVHDPDGPGPQNPVLVVGGSFESVTAKGTTVAAARVAAFNGTSWSSLGAGITGVVSNVTALASFDPDGAGPAAPLLLAGGSFLASDSAPADGLASWNGSSWSQFAGGIRPLTTIVGPEVSLLQPFDNAPGPAIASLALDISGSPAGRPAAHVVTWNGQRGWSDLLDGPSGVVHSLVAFSEPTGAHLFAAGEFATAGAQTVNNIARWDGRTWSALGTGIEPTASTPAPKVFATAVHNDGTGWALYAAGTFASAGGHSLRNIARWNGTSWQSVGAIGLSGGYVYALAVHDPDGPGPTPARLYAGGFFSFADSTPVSSLAVWDGAAWGPVAGGVSGTVLALRSFDDGSGPALYVGGYPMTAGGLPSNAVFKLAASGWQPLSNLAPLSSQAFVSAFAIHGVGSGYYLYALGNPRGNELVVRLDGTSWTDVSPPQELRSPWWRNALLAGRSTDDGRGPALFAGDLRYDGTWTALDRQANAPVEAMTQAFDDGNGPAIFLAGEFGELGAAGDTIPVAHIAKIPVCRPCYANCDQSAAPPVLNVLDFTCFIQKFAAGDSYANCDQSTSPPTLNVLDFTCFLQKFAAGCP